MSTYKKEQSDNHQESANKYCPRCLIALPPNVYYCPICGETVDAPQDDDAPGNRKGLANDDTERDWVEPHGDKGMPAHNPSLENLDQKSLLDHIAELVKQGDYAGAEHHYQEILDYTRSAFGEVSSQYAESLNNLASLYQAMRDNIKAEAYYRQALDIYHTVLGQDSAEFAEVMTNLANLCRSMYQNSEAEKLYHKALGIFRKVSGDGSQRVADMVSHLAALALEQGDHKLSRQLYERSGDIYEKLNNLSGQARSLHHRGRIAHKQGRYEEARNFYSQALAIREESGNQEEVASSLYQMGTLAQDQGEYEEARKFYHRSLQIGQNAGNKDTVANSFYQLATLAQEQGNYKKAGILYQQSLEVKRELGQRRNVAAILMSMGTLAQLQGRYVEAGQAYQSGLDIFIELDDQAGIAGGYHNLGVLAQEQGDCVLARRRYEQSLRIKEKLQDRAGIASTLHELGRLEQMQGNYQAAITRYHDSLAIKKTLGDQAGEATTLHQLGVLAQIEEQYDKAREYFQHELELATGLADQVGIAAAHAQMGVLAYLSSNYEEAYDFLVQALNTFVRVNSPHAQTARDYLEKINAKERRGKNMNAQDTYGQVAQTYADGVRSLLAPKPARTGERGGGQDVRSYDDLADQGEQLATVSAELTRASAEQLDAPNAEERAATSTKLLAKALVDLEVSVYLLQVAEDEEAGIKPSGDAGGERSAGGLGTTEEYLNLILGESTQIDKAVERGDSRPRDLNEARVELATTIQDALALLLERASKSGQAALGGLLALGASDLARAAGMLGLQVAEVLGQAEKVTRLYNLFRDFIARAYEALLALLGQAIAQKAADKVLEWVEDLRSGKLFGELLEKVYETKQTSEELSKLVGSSQASLEKFIVTIESIDSLDATYRQQVNLAEKGLGFLKLVGTLPAAVLPSGKLIMAAAYIILGGYIILVGADYVDSQRLQLLKRVPGVRELVTANLATA